MPNQRSGIPRSLIAGLASGSVALGACGDSPTEPLRGLGFCQLVDFNPGFQFTFFGTPYRSVFLNTNGGMTFGDGDDEYDPAAGDVIDPAIAVFWGDLDAGDTPDSEMRANQMTYQACVDRFIVTYTQMQDHSVPTWNNTATATLEVNGKITIEYGAVLSETVLMGVFDGTHTDDQYVTVSNGYSGYATNGTGTILFDSDGAGPPHAGELSNRTITFDP